MRRNQSSVEDIHTRVIDIDERFSHMLAEIETLVQSNQGLQDTVKQQSLQLESQSMQIQSLNLQLQIQNDKLRQSSQSLDIITQLVTDIARATNAGDFDLRRKRPNPVHMPGVSGRVHKEGSLDRARAIIARYVSEDLSKACMQLMRHMANTVTYLCKTEEDTQTVTTEPEGGRLLCFVGIKTWGEHSRDTRDKMVDCMETVFRSLPFTMSSHDLRTAASCFSELCVSNRRAQETRIYDKLCSTFKDTDATQWPVNFEPPKYTKVVSTDDAGNVTLRRRPSKEAHSAYESLVGVIPDYNKDDIVSYAKDKVKGHVEILAAAMVDEETNSVVEAASVEEPAEILDINQVVHNVMDQVMSSVLNTPVDNNTMDISMDNGNHEYEEDEDVDGDGDSSSEY
ncbi:hypothetical protein LPJ53_004450 [Coemansia erecta]|uniref:Uncharacterized protein n=1 Tax=Coemansia erecta TaxID=147472 RepID=A0A9W8CRB9_9FUNG|nr:hypothetical protein LPJ53_004450 [Coemansia erecta]